MKHLFTEEQVEAFASKYVKQLSEKLKDDFIDNIYQDISSYLYEHYENIKSKIETELIRDICEQFKNNPKDYKFKDLRAKIFEENKEQLVNLLVDEQIQENVEKIIWEYTHKEHSFIWKWEEAIGRFIINNIDEYADCERIQAMFARELQKKDDYINQLKKRLEALKEIIE